MERFTLKSKSPDTTVGCGKAKRPAKGYCPFGGWSGLFIRYAGWPQGEFVEKARHDGWDILRSPLGTQTTGYTESTSSSQIAGHSDGSLPKGAARRYYASNSFEVHLQAENVATIDSKCWRVGVDLRNLELSALCQPADVPDMDARLKADEAQFRQGNPTSGLADAFAAYNRDRPLPKSSVYPSASNAMPPVLYSTLLPKEAVKDARIVCRALGGINATESGYWTPAAMITVPKALPPRQMPEIAQRDRGVVAKLPKLMTVMAVVAGMGCDLYFFADAKGQVLDANGTRMFLEPWRGVKVPLMWYNVHFAAQFQCVAFAIDNSDEGFVCVSDRFGLSVVFDPPTSTRTGSSLLDMRWPVQEEGGRLLVGNAAAFYKDTGENIVGSRLFEDAPTQGHYAAVDADSLGPCPIQGGEEVDEDLPEEAKGMNCQQLGAMIDRLDAQSRDLGGWIDNLERQKANQYYKQYAFAYAFGTDHALIEAFGKTMKEAAVGFVEGFVLEPVLQKAAEEIGVYLAGTTVLKKVGEAMTTKDFETAIWLALQARDIYKAYHLNEDFVYRSDASSEEEYRAEHARATSARSGIKTLLKAARGLYQKKCARGSE